MGSPVRGFVENAREVLSAEPIEERDFVHVYQGTIDGVSHRVRLLTLHPTVEDEYVHTTFRRVSGQWHNPSSHPNIVTVYRRGLDPRPWIAVDVMNGQRLDSVYHTLTIRETKSVLADVAEAVRNAGLYNTRHGSLVPQFVWVNRTQEGVNARVDDWGLHRACHIAAGEPSLTPFTPPEGIESPETVTDQLDVYGLGAVAYYGLTGESPISVESGQSDLADAITTNEITPPTEKNPALPAAIDDVVLQSLAREPSDRQQSANEFKQALIRALPESGEMTIPTAESDAKTGSRTESRPRDDRNRHRNTASQTEQAGSNAAERKTGTTRSSGPSGAQTTPESEREAEKSPTEAPGEDLSGDSSPNMTRRVTLGTLGLSAVGASAWIATSEIGDDIRREIDSFVETDSQSEEGRTGQLDDEPATTENEPATTDDGTENTAGSDDVEQLEIVVSSKQYTEQINLGYLAFELLDNNTNHSVVDETTFGDNEDHANAYQNGVIHTYYEYMGTLWMTHPPQREESFDDPDEQHAALTESMESNHPIHILDRANWQNTWAPFLRETIIERTGIETVSDLAEYVNSGNYDIRLALFEGFRERSYGLNNLFETYGFESEHVQAWEEETGFQVMPSAVATGAAVETEDADFGFGYTTSAWLTEVDNVVILEDDQNFWPFFHPVGVLHEDVATDPVREELDKMVEAIPDVETMRDLNARAKKDDPQQVIRSHLSENGFI